VGKRSSKYRHIANTKQEKKRPFRVAQNVIDLCNGKNKAAVFWGWVLPEKFLVLHLYKKKEQTHFHR